MHKLQCFSKYDLLDLCNSSGFNYLQGRFNQIAPLIKPSFELHCSNHIFHKYVLNNCNTPGVYHQLDSGFKIKPDRLVEMTMPKSNLWR
jgi:hypothetical protein